MPARTEARATAADEVLEFDRVFKAPREETHNADAAEDR